MKRSFNFTERIKLPQQCINVRTFTSQDGSLSFRASLDLTDEQLPDGSSIYLEAYYRSAMMRFHMGYIRPDQTLYSVEETLSELHNPQVNFRIKIVDESEQIGRIVAVADHIRTFLEDAKQFVRVGLLPVQFDNIGDQIWRIEFSEDGMDPILFVNSTLETGNIPISELVRYPFFTSLVYPQVLRRILEYILIENSELIEDDPEGWANAWVRFGATLPGGEPLPKVDAGDDGELRDWIETTVQAFCTRLNIKSEFEKFIGELQ